ncbi:MAG: aspartate aminotransferase family protein [Leptonema sp. (in: bacteria)]
MKFIHHTQKKEIIKIFKNHVSSGKVNFFSSLGMDFIIGRRNRIYIYDVESNKELINCHCNGGVFNLGHRNAELIKILEESLQELDIGNHHLISEQRALLAKKLYQLTPGNLEYTVFGVSGGEAVDLAIKIARAYTKKSKIISAMGGYHGHTGFALATGDEKYKKSFAPLPPNFQQIEFNHIQALERAIEKNTAAVIFETIPATKGMIIPHRDYFKKVREICNQNKVLLIIDEIQSGLGRTGKLWGIEHFQTKPDIMILGKGLSGGIFPITATCFKKELEKVFHKDPFIHISTFGGAEVGCPVALKVLEISSSIKFLSHVNLLANFFNKELTKLKEEFPHQITSIHQLGLMMGIKMKNKNWGPILSLACYESGLLCIFANNDPSVLQFLPPLIINLSEAKEIMLRLRKAFELASSKKFSLKASLKFLKSKIPI